MSKHWAVIPVKGLTESKTRLSNYLGEKKKHFVQALLQDVLTSATRSGVYDRIMVVSPDEKVATFARDCEADFVNQSGVGLNRAVDQANRIALKENVHSLTTILADIPLSDPQDFREIFEMRRESRSVVLVPSLKGGTNVLLASPPRSIRPRYGRWSYSKHLRQAQVAGLDVYSISNPRISFDIDTVNDVVELRRRDPEFRTRSARILRDVRPLLTHARMK
ncbi:2-phospho-L-lactate guanylyltransferase [Candidatus Bathyarchaeota archaeon]|nr:2-phospho-L-lactate guanylyltransferase [Candidatus Bathyarchaeota archaeon]